MPDASEIRERIAQSLLEDVTCQVVDGDQPRIGCMTPLEYPNGDLVVVWVQPHGADFEVTDFGDGFTPILTHPAQDHKALKEIADAIVRGSGLHWERGRLTAYADLPEIGETVWQVALMSARIAQVADAFRPKRRTREAEFEHAVADTLRRRNVTVEQDRHKINGRSGHVHKVSLYVPEREAVLEPVTGHWNQVTAVFTRFGDLRNTNGYQLMSVIDDREEVPAEDVLNLLTEVSDVVQWSRRDDWIARVTGRYRGG